MQTFYEDIQKEYGDGQEQREILAVQGKEGWKRPLREHLEEGILHLDLREATLVAHRAKRYFSMQGGLFKTSLEEEVLKCIGMDEATKLMEEVHQGVARRHQEGRSLATELVRMGYY